MQISDNEKLITESEDKRLKLTSHRLRHYKNTSSKSDFTTIMLDKISSIELTYYKSSIWLLLVGILTIPIVLGLILIIMYFFSKKHVVSITPDGGTPIMFETKGMKREFLEDFIDKIESASLKLKGK